MSSLTATVDTAILDEDYADYLARGAALIEPRFGSTLAHVGPDSLDLLHRLTTNSLLDLDDGEARRTVLTNEKGRIVDVLWVLRRSAEELLLVSDGPDPGPMQRGIERFTIIEDAELGDLTGSLKRWYVVGPDATRLVGAVMPELEFSDSEVGSIRGADVVEGGVVLALRTDAAGAESWLLMVGQPAVPDIASRFAKLGLKPASQELFDFVRIENREPIAGKELTEDVNPLEAGLMDLIDFDKGCYVGQEVIARLDTYDKVQRTLTSFNLGEDEEGAYSASEGERIMSVDSGRDVGWVTSVARVPKSSRTIGLAILRTAFSGNDTCLATKQGTRIILGQNPRRPVGKI